MASKDFRPELFSDPSEYEETPLRDRKQELYNLRRDNEKAEFLRDVIAMANTARARGRPAYLLFGLDNDGNICDITGNLQPYLPDDSATLPTTDKEVAFTMERVRHAIGETIGQYIAPTLNLWDLKWGTIGDKLVAYLRIEPQCPSKAFHVARDLRSGRNCLLREGNCWIRQGESKFAIDWRELDVNSPGYSQKPLVPPSGWLRYFEKLLADQEIGRAMRKAPYLDLYSEEGVPLEMHLEEFLKSEEWILVIAGPPGSGKSMLLCRLVAEWAEAGMKAMQEIRRKEEFAPPPHWIPVYFKVKDAPRNDGQHLAKEILRAMNSHGQLWQSEPSDPEKLLEDPDLHWLVCFDGLDELWESQRVDRFLKAVRDLHRRFPRLKILISTRPTFSIPDFPVVQIAPLQENQIKRYLQAFVDENNELMYQQLERDFSDPQSELYFLREVCTTPLYVEALASVIAPYAPAEEESPESSPSAETGQVLNIPLEEGTPKKVVPKPISPEEVAGPAEDAPAIELDRSAEEEIHQELPADVVEFPPLTLGWVLDRTMQRIWEREEKRCAKEKHKTDRWWRATGELGLRIDGHRQFVEEKVAKKCYSPAAGLYWVLNLGILCSEREGIRFSHACLQHYFSADYLRIHPETRDRWGRHCTMDFWQAVQKILNQISYSGGDA